MKDYEDEIIWKSEKKSLRLYSCIILFVALSLDTQIFIMRYHIIYNVYTGYPAVSEIEHGSFTCKVNNPQA